MNDWSKYDWFFVVEFNGGHGECCNTIGEAFFELAQLRREGYTDTRIYREGFLKDEAR